MGQLNSYPNASTIDAVNDELVIWTNSLSVVQNINRNTFLNLASQPVGLTDSQTLTNKTLTSPTVSSPTFSGTLAGTYTIGGTPTFPASVTQNTVSQTLTNKTLTSPTITSPTITNATISADTLTGYTVSNTGTVYGMSVSNGILSSSALVGSVNTAAIASNAVLSAKLGLSSSYTGGVTSFSNSGSAGGTFYYVNLGGIKLMWGLTSTITINASSVSVNIAMPSFFTTIQGGYTTAGQNFVSDTRQIATFNPLSTTGNTTLACANVTGSTTSSASFFVYIIGT